MNTGINKLISGVLSSINQINYVPVRNRYYAEKIARGPIAKNFGYNDKVAYKGVLPRLKDGLPLPKPIYRPGNSWSKEKALAGQNDYIDILGDGKLRPSQVSYDVPKWLRGKRGHEMRLLNLKQRVFNNTAYQYENPTAWYNIRRRYRYLYKYLNFKTKSTILK